MGIKLNEQQQLENYIKLYGRLIFTICFSITNNYFDAEDLAQDTFLYALKSMKKFDGNNPKSWLSTIAINKCKDHLKRAANRKRASISDETLQTIPSLDPTTEERAIINESDQQVRKLCQKLKSPYRELAIRHFCDCVSIAEIAAETGTKLRTLQTRIYRAKSKLRELWKEEKYNENTFE